MTMPFVYSLPGRLRQELRASRKLSYGLFILAALALGEAGLRWSDRLAAGEKRLQDLRSEARSLRAQVSDEAALRESLAALQAARGVADARLWSVSSDATGQARTKDWLGGILKSAGVTQPNIVLSAPRPFAEHKEIVKREAGDAGDELREIRATVTIGFTPALLEQLLAAIEAGEPLAVVEALAVSRRDRRIELTARVLFRVVRSPASGGDRRP